MTTDIVIPIFFDYASSLCYVAWRIVRELEVELGFKSHWIGVPIAWRNARNRPGEPLSAIECMKISDVAIETGIRIVPPAYWIDSEAALKGSEAARAANCFDQYHTAVFRAAFEQRRNIADMDLLAGIAAETGMEAEKFKAELRAGVSGERLKANRAEADRAGAIGYPTFMLGEYPLIGIQPKPTMRLLIERFRQKRRAEGN
jgi:predicted DsbA family dithiol-disulfide isomerase